MDLRGDDQKRGGGGGLKLSQLNFQTHRGTKADAVSEAASLV